MKILVQTNNRKEVQLRHEFEKLEESGFEIVPFGYLEGTSNHTGKPFKYIELSGIEHIGSSEKTYMRICIPVLRKVFLEYVNLLQKSFLNTVQYVPSRFQITIIPESNHFLNKTPGKYVNTILLDALDYTSDQDMFIKPYDDLKLFSGTYIPAEKSLRQILDDKKELNHALTQMVYPVIISSNTLKLVQEVRCYVVDYKVVTMSKYMQNGKHDMSNLTLAERNDYLAYANYMIKYYAPCPNFTIDLAQTLNDRIKVVEYNCLTASGLYDCDTKALFTALNKYYYES